MRSFGQSEGIGLINTKKTVYDQVEEVDGKRTLVMRLRPREVSKKKVDIWMKELGTDRELIKGWKAGRINWAEFSSGYIAEPRGKAETQLLSAESRVGTIISCAGAGTRRTATGHF